MVVSRLIVAPDGWRQQQRRGAKHQLGAGWRCAVAAPGAAEQRYPQRPLFATARIQTLVCGSPRLINDSRSTELGSSVVSNGRSHRCVARANRDTKVYWVARSNAPPSSCSDAR